MQKIRQLKNIFKFKQLQFQKLCNFSKNLKNDQQEEQDIDFFDDYIHIEPLEKQKQNVIEDSNKFYKQDFILFPSSQPLFPQNTMATRINPILYDYLQKQKIQYVGAFAIKEQNQMIDIQVDKLQEEKEQEYEQEQKQQNKKFFKKKKEVIQKNMQEDFKKMLQENLEDFHQNIVYDDNVVQEDEEIKIKVVQNEEDIYKIGTLCKLNFEKQMIDDQLQILAILKGVERIRLIKMQEMNNQIEKQIQINNINEIGELVNMIQVEEYKTNHKGILMDTKYMRVYGQLIKTFQKYKQKISVNTPELIFNPQDYKNIDILCGYLAITSYFTKEQKQGLLEIQDIKQRVQKCLQYFEEYLDDSQKQLDKYKNNVPITLSSQKQQMEEIYKYLTKNYDQKQSNIQIQKLEKQMQEREFPKLVQKLLKEKLEELQEMNENHPEYQQKKQLIDMILELPYGQQSDDNFDIKLAAQILDDEHYGMQEVKERILQFIAVAKLRNSLKSKVLLLQGPPGVGKTSIAQSIANCLKRKYGRISLGGETDTAIIKGHRKTYMGAYPGKIVQLLKQLKVENPVILLDEIDKMGKGMRGNIADTLLEILDPEQNHKFIDNYLEVEIDLSKVLFICSANLLETISQPLLDRMEIIQLRGYTFDEKLQISQKYLLPKALKETGIYESEYHDKFDIDSKVIKQIILKYCRESGVRNLQRQLIKICENSVFQFLTNIHNSSFKIDIQENQLIDYLGLPLFADRQMYDHNQMPKGVIIGLAYNSYGGSVLYIETMNLTENQENQTEKQKIQNQDKDQKNDKQQKLGSIQFTGQLGDVMSESVEIAFSYAKYLCEERFNNTFLQQNQIHIHFPEGATPKDGPSAGVAITSSLLSQAFNKAPEIDVAMTGEISLTGKVLKIGGVKEKVLAAKRENIQNVILPFDNKSDVEELDKNIQQNINFHFVQNYPEVIKILWPSLNSN